MLSNTGLASAPYSSPSDFRYKAPDTQNRQHHRNMVGNDFHFGGNFAPRPFEESLVMHTDLKESQAR